MPDPVDALIAHELAQWQPLLEPMVQPLRRLLESAAAQGLTAGELAQRLPALLQEMDASALTAALTRTSFAAAAGYEAGADDVAGL